MRQQILDYFARHRYVVVGQYLRVDTQNLYFEPLSRRDGKVGAAGRVDKHTNAAPSSLSRYRENCIAQSRTVYEFYSTRAGA